MSINLPEDEWEQKFQELLRLAENGNPHVNDSREGIYAERIAIQQGLDDIRAGTVISYDEMVIGIRKEFGIPE